MLHMLKYLHISHFSITCHLQLRQCGQTNFQDVGSGNSCRGDVVEIDSWVAAEGKNGMRRDFLVRDITTGQVISRATRCVAHLLTCLLLGFAPKFSAFCCSVENQVYNQFKKK